MSCYSIKRELPEFESCVDECSNSMKRQKVDIEKDELDNHILDDCEEFKEAVRILEKQKEDRLLLVQSKLNLLIENANHLAECEKRHMEEVYEECTIDIQKRIEEENQIKTRSMAAEEIKQKHNSSRLDVFSLSNPTGATISLPKKDQCCFTVPLKEKEMIDDLLYMSHSTKQLCKDCDISPICTVVPLSNNRLLLNDHVIYPNTPCTVRTSRSEKFEGVFLSTVVKEKEVKEKKKEPEFVLKVSATRKRRFPIESLRNGDIELFFRLDDIRLAKEDNEYNDSDEHDYYNDNF